MPEIIDLRSDTVTQPTPAMRAAMAAAPVGDDVFNEDPSILRLEAQTAELLGKEAAIFVPSGTMSNQIGVRLHCAPGDEFICEAGCHIYNYEQGAYAQLSGVAVRAIEGRSGVLERRQLEGMIRPDNDHCVRTKVLCLENTHNRGSGRVQPYDNVVDLCDWAHESGIKTHLDGARLMNAVVATGISAAQWSAHFETVSICFSKGLGAPVGSALAGPCDLIKTARRHRKLFGGAMRQAGILAAAASYALDHHVTRLAEDHEHAQLLATAIRETSGLTLRPETIDTNILFFAVDPSLGTAAQFAAQLRERGLLCLALSASTIRLVTHLDVSRQQIERACVIILNTAEAAIRLGPPTLEAASYG